MHIYIYVKEFTIMHFLSYVYQANLIWLFEKDF